MAVHSQDQQKAVVTSAKGRSLFSLCPRRTPRVVAEDETACTHFIVPLGTEDDLRANLLVEDSEAATLYCSQEHNGRYGLRLSFRLGRSVVGLPLPVVPGKVKRLRASDSQALEGAASCLRVSHGEFSDANHIRNDVLERLNSTLKAAEAAPDASASLALHAALQECTAILRPHDAKQDAQDSIEAVLATWAPTSRSPVKSPVKIIADASSRSAPGSPLIRCYDDVPQTTQNVAEPPHQGFPLLAPSIGQGAAGAAADAVQLHFMQFARLYHEPLTDSSTQCIHHLQALLHLAGNPAPQVRERFLRVGVIAMLLREVSLELDMLPKSTGEAAASPAMSAAYSPINSPKASSWGDSQSLLGGKTSARGEAKASLLRTSQTELSDQPGSGRISAWQPGDRPGQAPSPGKDLLPATSTFCSTYTPVQGSPTSTPGSGEVAVASPKAEVLSWAIANLEEEIFDTHRSSVYARSRTPSPTRHMAGPAPPTDTATPDMAKALGISSEASGQAAAKRWGPPPAGPSDSPTTPLTTSAHAASPLPFRGFDEVSSASKAEGSRPFSTPGQQKTSAGIPRLVFATPSVEGQAPPPKTPAALGAGNAGSRSHADLSDNDEDEHSCSDSTSSSCSDDGLPTTTAKQQPACVPRLQLLTPLALPLKGKDASRTPSAGITPVTPSPGPPASIHKATLVQAEAGGCATAKKEQAAGQLTGRKLDLRRLALEASTARAHSSRHLEAAVVDAALPVVEAAQPTSPEHGEAAPSSASSRRGAGTLSTSSSPSPSPQARYREIRCMRRLYTDHQIHLLGLNLILKLLIPAGGDDLDPLFAVPGPNNALYPLWRHLSHKDNAALIPALESAVALSGKGPLRLLRILTPALFPKDRYHTWRRIARGASAEIYRCRYDDASLGSHQDVVVKAIDLPSSALDPCIQAEVFAEVALLERFAHSPHVTQLLSYGCNKDNAFLVMTAYAGSLAQWRKRQPADPRPCLRMYLAVFLEVVAAVQALAAHNLVHFDLKCDNILLQPLPGAAEDTVWACPPDRPPFHSVLADFGVSRQYASAAQAFTVRSRGTEATKSPEMLMVDMPAWRNPPATPAGAMGVPGPASDIWGLGCLLYELLTGTMLFNEPDWLQFYMRLTRSDQELFPKEQVDRVSHLPGVMSLLQGILVRDPHQRPSLEAISSRVNETLKVL